MTMKKKPPRNLSTTKRSAKTKRKTTTGPKPPPAALPNGRLDIALAQRFGISRQQAQGVILAGHVRVNGVTQRKAGFALPDGATLELEAEERFVGRGGYKLEQALDAFRWPVKGLRCLDVGASTGGFTDCLLQRGASAVTALDVGYGHLAWKLRQDPRVTVLERSNFRHAGADSLGLPYDFISIDVSFISLTKLARQLAAALVAGGRLVALVKPQFEAGRSDVGRGGVVHDPRLHERTVREVIEAFEGCGLRCVQLAFSPIKGPAGNIEFLLGATSGDGDAPAIDVAGVVARAHEALD
jgi:23S rRNA (cytidine1920-2'-O)/16S rRNA (cytidine1409-2'-O)-methyltransferase